MPTLLLPPRLNEDTEALRVTAERLPNWKAVVAPQWRLSPDFTLPESVAIYGDPLFADLAAAALDLDLLQPPLDFLPGLPERLVLRTVRLTTLAEARTVEVPAFIKPAEDKSFSAQVYNSGTELPGSNALLPDNMPVLISGIVTWAVEFRCFVRAGDIVTLSPYFRNGELAREGVTGEWITSVKERAEAAAFAQSVLKETENLPPAVVLDVGFIAGQGWAVVEANPVWASGLYGCEREAVLETLTQGIRQRSSGTESDSRFIRTRIKVEE